MHTHFIQLTSTSIQCTGYLSIFPKIEHIDCSILPNHNLPRILKKVQIVNVLHTAITLSGNTCLFYMPIFKKPPPPPNSTWPGQ